MNHIVDMLSTAGKHEKTVMGLMKNICDQEKLYSDMNYSAVGCEFTVSESTIWYIQEKEGDISQFVYEATLESTKVTSIVCDKAMEKMEKCLNLWIYEMAISFCLFFFNKDSNDIERQTIL